MSRKLQSLQMMTYGKRELWYDSCFSSLFRILLSYFFAGNFSLGYFPRWNCFIQAGRARAGLNDFYLFVNCFLDHMQVNSAYSAFFPPLEPRFEYSSWSVELFISPPMNFASATPTSLTTSLKRRTQRFTSASFCFLLRMTKFDLSPFSFSYTTLPYHRLLTKWLHFCLRYS